MRSRRGLAKLCAQLWAREAGAREAPPGEGGALKSPRQAGPCLSPHRPPSPHSLFRARAGGGGGRAENWQTSRCFPAEPGSPSPPAFGACWCSERGSDAWKRRESLARFALPARRRRCGAGVGAPPRGSPESRCGAGPVVDLNGRPAGGMHGRKSSAGIRPWVLVWLKPGEGERSRLL